MDLQLCPQPQSSVDCPPRMNPYLEVFAMFTSPAESTSKRNQPKWMVLIGLSIVCLSALSAHGALDRTGDMKVTSADLPILLKELINNPNTASIMFQIADAWGMTESSESTINFREYFPLAQNSNWTYVGFNGGSTEDNFTWTVENSQQDVGGGKKATRIRTNTQEPADDRNLDVDFWYLDTNTGDVFFYGLHVGTVKGSGIFTLPIQDIVLTDPLKVGKDGMLVGGAPLNDTGAGSVKVNTPLGQQTINGVFTASIQVTEIVPVFNTPLGNFTNVIRMVVNLKVSGFGQDFVFENSTFFLKKGVGMVAQDQQPDPNDAQLQGIQSGKVAGVNIVAN